MSKIFATFIGDYVRRERHHTASTYRILLSQFERWMGERRLKDFNEAHVLEFLDEKRWANASKNTFLSAVRRWAKAEKARIPSGTTLEDMQRYRDVEKRLELIASLENFKAKPDQNRVFIKEALAEMTSESTPRELAKRIKERHHVDIDPTVVGRHLHVLGYRSKLMYRKQDGRNARVIKKLPGV